LRERSLGQKEENQKMRRRREASTYKRFGKGFWIVFRLLLPI